MSESKKGPGDFDLASREKKPSPLGTAIFVGLRAADAVLQYQILQQGWGQQLVSTLGGAPVPFAAPRDPTLAYFGLGPYPALMSALALGSSVKHISWILGVSEQEMPPAAAVLIAAFNTVLNTSNTLLSCWALTSQAPQMETQSTTMYDMITASPVLAIGLGLYTVGITTEMVAEVQRKMFKSDPKNEGKPYGGGLWSLATNINYGGYTLWRTGAALSAAGPMWGIIIGAFFFYDFTRRAIPSLDAFCTEKVSPLNAFNDLTNLLICRTSTVRNTKRSRRILHTGSFLASIRIMSAA